MLKVAKRTHSCKPAGDSPPRLHSTGYWFKKIDGKFRYFGHRREDPDGSRARKLWDDFRDGRTPADPDATTLEDLCDLFRSAKDRALDRGDINERTYNEYIATCKRLRRVFGKDRVVNSLLPANFDELLVDIAKKWGPVRTGNEVGKVKTIFKFGFLNGYCNAARFGSEFKKPPAKQLRKHRRDRGSKMIEADELRRLFAAAEQPLQAMFYLSLNCGFGNHDLALLPRMAVDLARGWIDFPRPKTAIGRRCPLWPETIAAMREAEQSRGKPKDKAAAKLFFLTVRGRQWLCRGIANPISVLARRAMKAAGIDRPGVGLYSLRHVFRTIADEAGDQPAANAIMGHSDRTIANHYRERIVDRRLQAVVDYVHNWLFGQAQGVGNE